MPLIKTHIQQKIHVIFLILIAITFPFSMQINTWAILGLGAFSLISGSLLSGIKTASKKPYVLLLWLFILIHLVSALLSKNMHEGLSIIERKGALFFLPMFILSNPISNIDIKKITLSFVIGIITAFIICLCWAVYQYAFVSHEIECFFYQKFSYIINMNAVYLSSYSVIAIHILLYYYNELNKYVTILSILLLILFCFLLSSKMMLACLAFGIIFFGFQKLKIMNAFVLVITVIGCMGFIIFTVPNIKQRISTEFQSNMSVVNQTHFTYDTPFTGTSLRIVFWKTSMEILNEKQAWLIGVHTGDFQDLLNEKYKEKGIYTGNPELKDTGYLGYGPHNQYIEILLSIGVLGLFVFICLLGYYVKTAWVLKNYLAFQFIFLFIFFFLSESVLSVNKGIVIFTFFSLLFLCLKPCTKESY